MSHSRKTCRRRSPPSTTTPPKEMPETGTELRRKQQGTDTGTRSRRHIHGRCESYRKCQCQRERPANELLELCLYLLLLTVALPLDMDISYHSNKYLPASHSPQLNFHSAVAGNPLRRAWDGTSVESEWSRGRSRRRGSLQYNSSDPGRLGQDMDSIRFDPWAQFLPVEFKFRFRFNQRVLMRCSSHDVKSRGPLTAFST